MPETAPAASITPPSARALAARTGLARAAVFWERYWPEFAPALAVLGVFVAAALFELPVMVPGWLHALGLTALAALFVAALWHAMRGLRIPDAAEGRRRLESASDLAHRPLVAVTDRLAGGAGDPVAMALWEAHRQHMARRIGRLRIGIPLAGFLRRDPYGLRVVLAIALVLGVFQAGGDAGSRVLRALVPQLGYSPAAAANISLDIWITPPDYTGQPPLFLQRGATQEPIAIPAGSGVLAQVQGGHNPPRLEVDGKATDFTRIDDKNFKGSTTLAAGKDLSVVQDGRTLGAWKIAVIPDQPPTIEFVGRPQKTLHNAVRIEFHAADDYGVEGAKTVIRLPENQSAEAIELDLPLPGLHLKDARNANFYDLTAHPWAGLPVEIQLEATDALGQTGRSEKLAMTLPERVFNNPFARSLIDQRRELSLHPQDRDVVAEALSDLSTRPAFFGGDEVVFLGLRIAAARLAHDDPKTAIPTVQQLLWDLALRIEDGHEALAQRDLREIMQALQNAIARNAPDAEIDRLTRELKAAIDRYLQALAENMRRQNSDAKDMPLIDPSRLMSDRDLQRMLDRARDLARTGARDAARDLLAQLQNMLENLRLAQPRQMQGNGNEVMRGLQQLMNRQQQLLDRSFRQSRQAQRGQPKPGSGQGDAADQEALRRMLGEIMRQLGEQTDVPQALGRADRSMRDAVEALGRGAPGDAIGPQTDALDAIQQATKDLVDQMMSAFGGPGGNSDLPDGVLPNADRDPLGRPMGDSADGTYTDGRLRLGRSAIDSFGIERAKQILEELRRRAGDTSRPDSEREYIDRLLRRF